MRSQAMASLPRLTSKKHTGFAFDTPGFESFFAKQVRAYSVAAAAATPLVACDLSWNELRLGERRLGSD